MIIVNRDKQHFAQ